MTDSWYPAPNPKLEPDGRVLIKHEIGSWCILVLFCLSAQWWLLMEVPLCFESNLTTLLMTETGQCLPHSEEFCHMHGHKCTPLHTEAPGTGSSLTSPSGTGTDPFKPETEIIQEYQLTLPRSLGLASKLFRHIDFKYHSQLYECLIVTLGQGIFSKFTDFNLLSIFP